MDQGREDKKIFYGKPEGSRRTGRPRVRWLEDVGKDLWEIRLRDGDRRQSGGKNGPF
jgi:hypothetical protein